MKSEGLMHNDLVYSNLRLLNELVCPKTKTAQQD